MCEPPPHYSMNMRRAFRKKTGKKIKPTEEKILRAIYQDGKTEDDLICVLGLQDNEVAAWAMCKAINAKAGRASKTPAPIQIEKNSGFSPHYFLP